MNGSFEDVEDRDGQSRASLYAGNLQEHNPLILLMLELTYRCSFLLERLAVQPH